MRPGSSPTDPMPYECGDGESFILHDGPPYANGKLHMGHALNKLLKDMILRDRRRMGYHAPFEANWDCHGLPLEQRFNGKRHRFESTTSYLAVVEREARKWADVQDKSFQELGIAYDPTKYLSCDKERQGLIMREFHRMVSKGLVSQRSHPSSWSPMDGTVLSGAEKVDSEQEVETATVLFPVNDSAFDKPTYLAVWTTTPWSLPGNAGVAYNPSLSYALHEEGQRYVVAMEGSLPDLNHKRTLSTEEMATMMPLHPLHDAGYPVVTEMPALMSADFVTADKGTGLVHIGPAHAMEDYNLWREHHGESPFPDVVQANGCYHDDLPLFGGLSVVDLEELGQANDAVLNAVRDRGHFLSSKITTMTLEASWRSGGLLVTRPTAQWFIDLKEARARAVDALESGKIKMYPEKSKTRLLSMIKTRPDWLVSRQREWGVPLGLYVHKETGEVETDENLLTAVSNCVYENGLSGWWDVSAKEHFAAAGRDDWETYEKVEDVLDVWFDSACVHNYSGTYADLVVEGSDQHRGWYSSTLLKAMALEDPLPFKAILTHGFVVDENRRKMSKSSGNGTTPDQALKKWRRDVLRLWVAHVDVTEDVPFSNKVLDEAAKVHASMRNTMRYLTGVLRNWSKEDEKAVSNWAPDHLLDAEIEELENQSNQALESYDMRKRMEIVRDFLNHRMSGFHLDARKDRLYCEAGSPGWHATRASLMNAYRVLIDLLKPLCPDMVEEMISECAPQNVHRSSSKDWLSYVETTREASTRVGSMCKNAEVKLKDAEIHVAHDDKMFNDLLEVIDHEALARLLKVDKVVLTDGETRAVESKAEECPRCRLHNLKEEETWCHRCTDHTSQYNLPVAA